MRLLIVLSFLLVCSFTTNAQELSVFSGFWAPEYYQDDVQITKQEAKSLLLNYQGSETYWKRKMTNEALFYGTYIVALGGAFWLGAESAKNEQERDITAPAIVTGGGLLISLIFYSSAAKNGKKAILAYNKKFDNRTTSFELVPISNSKGLGLALRF